MEKLKETEEESLEELIKFYVAFYLRSLGVESTSDQVLSLLSLLYVDRLMKLSSVLTGITAESNRTLSNAEDIEIMLKRFDVSIDDLLSLSTFASPHVIPTADAVQSGKKTFLTPSRPHPMHIPSFMPPFPPDYTYSATPVLIERETDKAAVLRKRGERKRIVQSNLMELLRKTVAVEFELPVVDYERWR